MQLELETMKVGRVERRHPTVCSVILMQVGLFLGACEQAEGPKSTIPPTPDSGVGGAVDGGELDSHLDTTNVVTDSGISAVDGTDAGIGVRLGDGAGTGDFFDGEPRTEDGETAVWKDADANSETASVDAGGAGSDAGSSVPEDVHVVVLPPSTKQVCACWPEGDDCDKFFGKVDWDYKERPPCPEGEVCTGDYYGPGKCRAKCDQAEPGQAVRLVCHPSEKCKTIEMFDWEGDTKALETLCVPK